MGIVATLGACGACLLHPAAPLSSQDGPAGRLAPRPLPAAAAREGAPSAGGPAGPRIRPQRPRATADPADEATGPERAFTSSLLLPGAGQWLQGQERSYLYLGLELAGWAAFLHGRLRGAALRDRYRDLAWEEARPRSTGARADGDFPYYEALAEYGASGTWDADPGRPGIQPETDPETYNGAVWSLAREVYSLDPESPDPGSPAYERALEFYRERGYRPELAWDWSGDEGAVERYRRLIDESDGAFRRATVVLAVIVTNHVVSAVDGFLSARIGTGDAPGARTLSSPSSSRAPSPPAERGRVRLELRVSTP